MKTFATKANAKRAALSLLEKLPDTIYATGVDVVGIDGAWSGVIVVDHAVFELADDDVALLAGFDVQYMRDWDDKVEPTTVLALDVLEPRPTVGKPAGNVLRKSAMKGSVALVHNVLDTLDRELSRKDAIAHLVGMGIATNTAKTQYQRWFTAQKTQRLNA